MIRLYPSSIQFQLGAATSAALIFAGMTGWAGEWAWCGVLAAVAFAGCIASAFIATREG